MLDFVIQNFIKFNAKFLDSFLSSLRRQSTGGVSDSGSFRPVAISSNKPASNFSAHQKQQHQQEIRQQTHQHSTTSSSATTTTTKYQSTMQQHQQQSGSQSQIHHQAQPFLYQSSSQQQQIKSHQTLQQQYPNKQSQHSSHGMEWSNNDNYNQSAKTATTTTVNSAAPVPVNGPMADLSLVEATSPVWYRLKISRQEGRLYFYYPAS